MSLPERRSERVYVALGSNLGDRAALLAKAVRQLSATPEITVLATSRVEETPPLGGRDQPAYLNQMVELETTLSPRALLNRCQQIEEHLGRVRRAGDRWLSRTIDLDIVRFGDRRIDEDGLTIPHPRLAERDFWRRELEELASERT